jgi:SAM-dependent methyltransferase
LLRHLVSSHWSKTKIINAVLTFNNEERNLIRFLRSLALTSEHKILDVGCGYGKKSALIRSLGFNVVGVEINSHLVELNLKAGLNCMTVTDFEQTNDLYDVLIMSHLIEHFQPGELLIFIDSYLDRLKPGGYLIIATPLETYYFYDDFDHIKPYHPTGFNMVFTTKEAQVQCYSKHTLKLLDIWFRRRSFQLVFFRGLYIPKSNRLPLIINLALAVLFRLSLGLIGKTDGWMGLYRKM